MGLIYDKSKDSYEILGISPAATDEEIKKRYRELSKLYHPDLHTDENSSERQKEINEAYDNINDKNRAEYDRLRKKSLGFKGMIETTINDLSKTASNLAFRFINSSGIESLEAYDNYILFLREIEPEFQKYGESIIPFIDGVGGKRGKISKDILEQYKITVKRELEYVKRRAAAFDDFQVFYQKAIDEMKRMHNKTLNMKEYTDPLNRTKYNVSNFEKKKAEITALLNDLNQKRLCAIDNLKVELAKRFIRYNEFLNLRGLKEETMSMNTITDLKELLSLMDQLKIILIKKGIAIEDYLFNAGYNIMTVSKSQLEFLLAGLTPKQNNDLEELDRILREEDNETKTM